MSSRCVSRSSPCTCARNLALSCTSILSALKLSHDVRGLVEHLSAVVRHPAGASLQPALEGRRRSRVILGLLMLLERLRVVALGIAYIAVEWSARIVGQALHVFLLYLQIVSWGGRPWPHRCGGGSSSRSSSDSPNLLIFCQLSLVLYAQGLLDFPGTEGGKRDQWCRNHRRIERGIGLLSGSAHIGR
jgi:hypothetical protein